MTAPDRWERIEQLYHDALARDEHERATFLRSACGADNQLRSEVESLLARNEAAEVLFAVPALQTFGDLLTADVDPGPEGATFGGYRIERLLGRGGMGSVFLAYDTRLDRRVALKLVEVPADGDAARRLLREARNAAALNHPNICTVHEAGEVNGSAFIAMEYVPGRSLRERLDEGALDLTDAIRYGLQVAEALAYAHDQGVVHRDLKAANAIVTEGGRLKIVDFGLAHRADAAAVSATTLSSLVPPGTPTGTPYAMAPEQVRGESADAHTDIWALGVLLYELVTGAKPFRGAAVAEMFSAILRDPPAPLPDSVPVGLRVLIERCLAKQPKQRYRHAADVQSALEAIQAGTVPRSIAWRYRLNRRLRLLSATVLVAIAAALASLNVGGLRDRLIGNAPETAPLKLAVLPLEDLSGGVDQQYCRRHTRGARDDTRQDRRAARDRPLVGVALQGNREASVPSSKGVERRRPLDRIRRAIWRSRPNHSAAHRRCHREPFVG
jgi:predicted Ser/Thr protein kinase